MSTEKETIAAHLQRSGVSRRSFLQLCSKVMVAAPMGLALTSKRSVAQVAQLVSKSRRPSVIWLHFQDCTGCTETLLRTSAPDVAHLILDVISLDYHETLMAASGAQAEAALRSAIQENAGKFVLIIEGAIPAKDDGIFMELASKPAIQVAKDVASQAAAVIAIGSCASWGGVPSADPNPTGAVGVDSVVSGKPIINLPGCPPNPYNLLAVVLEYVTMGRLPELDEFSRPKFAYDRVIHENCPRRAHFDAGRFATAFGDEGTAKDGVSTNSAAKDRLRTPPALRGTSTKCPECGRSVLVFLVSVARKKTSSGRWERSKQCPSILPLLRKRIRRSTAQPVD
jgi:hydrogenase small subunit